MSAKDELIVVDNGSTDGSALAVGQEFPQAKVVALAENQYIFALNAGLERASGRYVAFCNNDMVVEPGFIDEALGLFGDNIFAVCARIIDRHGKEQGSRTSGRFKHGVLIYDPLPHVEHPTRCFFAVGGQSFYDRQKLVELGSIDELLHPMYHEDIELSYRAWKRGWEIVYAPKSVCHHLGGTTSSKVFTPVELRSFVRQNEVLTVWKDVTNPIMLVQHLCWLVVRFAKAVVVDDRGTTRGTLNAFRRLRGAAAARRRVAHQFLISDREVLRRVSLDAVERPMVSRCA